MTAIDVIVILVYVYSCMYLLGAVLIAAGERRFRPAKLPSNLPSVSVILCTRDEEHTIRRCLDSLSVLDYPRKKLEIICVDDESEDHTLDILKEYAGKDTVFMVLTTASEPRDLPGKQRPLYLGIRHAKGEILITTDADCSVHPGWVRGHISAYQENIGIVGGITKIATDSGSLFARVQNCDQVSKLAVAMGCAGLGIPFAIMGNNMSFRREAYQTCGGFEKIRPSIVEDVDLMYAITRNTAYRLGWTNENKSVVVSTREKNFNAFIEQRCRMLTIMKKVPFIGKGLIVIEILMTVILGAALIMSLCDIKPLAFTGFAWILGNFLVISPVHGYRFKDNAFIPGMFIFQFVYGIVIGYRSFLRNKNVVWKGRVYEKK